jgi:hypothetical protein
MASHRDAKRGRDPQRAGSLPEEPASTSQPRTVSMSADLVDSIERGPGAAGVLAARRT